MRHLILMRHAEAGFVSPTQSDFERPLTERGRNEARMQGRKLTAQRLVPDLVLCSPALRTQTTWHCVAEGIGDYLSSDFTLHSPQHLYQASKEILLNALCDVGNQVDVVMILAHNPGIHELAIASSQPIEGHERSSQSIALKANYPTATMTIFSFPLASWQQAKHETLTLDQIITV